MHRFTAVGAVLLAACGSADPIALEPDAGIPMRDGGDAVHDGGDAVRDGGAGPDAAIDAGFETLPVEPGDVIALSDANDIEIFTVGFSSSTGAELFIERYNEPFTSSVLARSTLSGRTFTQPMPQTIGTNTLIGSPSAVTIDGVDYLYAAHTDDIQGAAAFVRRAFDGVTLGSVEPIVRLPSMSTLLSWPQVIALREGGAAVAYRNDLGLPQFARSTDGLRFDPPVQVHTEGSAIPTVAELTDGTLVFTHQRPVMSEPMVSWWQLSADGGATWTAPARVTTSSSNVHDTTVVIRRNGAADLYYIYPASAAGFVLFRRRLDKDGTLGPEQQVTANSVLEPSKPKGLRLADGTLLLTFAEISQRSRQGLPTIQRTKALLLRTEAP